MGCGLIFVLISVIILLTFEENNEIQDGESQMASQMTS